MRKIPVFNLRDLAAQASVEFFHLPNLGEVDFLSVNSPKFISPATMHPIKIQFYESVIGDFILGSFQGKLCLLDFRNRKTRVRVDRRIQAALRAEYAESACEVLEETKKQLQEYLLKDRKIFDLPLWCVGTEFQNTVWSSVSKIAYGRASNYLQLAHDISRPKAVRAVANAIGANALSIIIPCHRILGSNAQLGGYSGGLAAKKYLLQLEASTLSAPTFSKKHQLPHDFNAASEPNKIGK